MLSPAETSVHLTNAPFSRTATTSLTATGKASVNEREMKEGDESADDERGRGSDDFGEQINVLLSLFFSSGRFPIVVKV